MGINDEAIQFVADIKLKDALIVGGGVVAFVGLLFYFSSRGRPQRK